MLHIPPPNVQPGSQERGRRRLSEQHDKLDWLRMLLVWLLPAVACALALVVIGPPPPSSLRIAAGETGGAYTEVAQSLATQLRTKGFNLTVVRTHGAEENLRLIGGERQRADVALVQGGLIADAQRAGLVSVGRLFYEPLWVFLKAGSGTKSLAALKGKRLSVGALGSGTRIMSEAILAMHGIDTGNTTLLHMDLDAARQALVEESIDAAFIVAAARAPVVKALLSDPSLEILSLPNAAAYGKHMPYLTHVVLNRGSLDLRGDRPAQDVALVATSAALVMRKDIPPALGYLLAEAAQEVTHEPGLLHKAGEFPIAHDPELAMSDGAKRFYRHGAPFLYRYLSFWLADFVERALTLVLPLAAIVLPLARGLWWLYQWLVHQRILKWYAELRRLEEWSEDIVVAEQAQLLLEKCDSLSAIIRARNVPLPFADQVYALQSNVHLIRLQIVDRQKALQAQHAGS